jgi:hypothetical protein
MLKQGNARGFEMSRLTSTEVIDFMLGKTLYSFDPGTRTRAAAITYSSDGTCVAAFEDGTKDKGAFTIHGDTYETQYEVFRAGSVNRFYLMWLMPGIVQAYHTDGRRAFVQTELAALPDGLHL